MLQGAWPGVDQGRDAYLSVDSRGRVGRAEKAREAQEGAALLRHDREPALASNQMRGQGQDPKSIRAIVESLSLAARDHPNEARSIIWGFKVESKDYEWESEPETESMAAFLISEVSKQHPSVVFFTKPAPGWE